MVNSETSRTVLHGIQPSECKGHHKASQHRTLWTPRSKLKRGSAGRFMCGK